MNTFINITNGRDESLGPSHHVGLDSAAGGATVGSGSGGRGSMETVGALGASVNSTTSASGRGRGTLTRPKIIVKSSTTTRALVGSVSGRRSLSSTLQNSLPNADDDTDRAIMLGLSVSAGGVVAVNASTPPSQKTVGGASGGIASTTSGAGKKSRSFLFTLIAITLCLFFYLLRFSSFSATGGGGSSSPSNQFQSAHRDDKGDEQQHNGRSSNSNAIKHNKDDDADELASFQSRLSSLRQQVGVSGGSLGGTMPFDGRAISSPSPLDQRLALRFEIFEMKRLSRALLEERRGEDVNPSAATTPPIISVPSNHHDAMNNGADDVRTTTTTTINVDDAPTLLTNATMDDVIGVVLKAFNANDGGAHRTKQIGKGLRLFRKPKINERLEAVLPFDYPSVTRDHSAATFYPWRVMDQTLLYNSAHVGDNNEDDSVGINSSDEAPPTINTMRDMLACHRKGKHKGVNYYFAMERGGGGAAASLGGGNKGFGMVALRGSCVPLPKELTQQQQPPKGTANRRSTAAAPYSPPPDVTAIPLLESIARIEGGGGGAKPLATEKTSSPSYSSSYAVRQFPSIHSRWLFDDWRMWEGEATMGCPVAADNNNVDHGNQRAGAAAAEANEAAAGEEEEDLSVYVTVGRHRVSHQYGPDTSSTPPPIENVYQIDNFCIDERDGSLVAFGGDGDGKEELVGSTPPSSSPSTPPPPHIDTPIVLDECCDALYTQRRFFHADNRVTVPLIVNRENTKKEGEGVAHNHRQSSHHRWERVIGASLGAHYSKSSSSSKGDGGSPSAPPSIVFVEDPTLIVPMDGGYTDNPCHVFFRVGAMNAMRRALNTSSMVFLMGMYGQPHMVLRSRLWSTNIFNVADPLVAATAAVKPLSYSTSSASPVVVEDADDEKKVTTNSNAKLKLMKRKHPFERLGPSALPTNITTIMALPLYLRTRAEEQAVEAYIAQHHVAALSDAYTRLQQEQRILSMHQMVNGVEAAGDQSVGAASTTTLVATAAPPPPPPSAKKKGKRNKKNNNAAATAAAVASSVANGAGGGGSATPMPISAEVQRRLSRANLERTAAFPLLEYLQRLQHERAVAMKKKTDVSSGQPSNINNKYAPIVDGLYISTDLASTPAAHYPIELMADMLSAAKRMVQNPLSPAMTHGSPLLLPPALFAAEMDSSWKAVGRGTLNHAFFSSYASLLSSSSAGGGDDGADAEGLCEDFRCYDGRDDEDAPPSASAISSSSSSSSPSRPPPRHCTAEFRRQHRRCTNPYISVPVTVPTPSIFNMSELVDSFAQWVKTAEDAASAAAANSKGGKHKHQSAPSSKRGGGGGGGGAAEVANLIRDVFFKWHLNLKVGDDASSSVSSSSTSIIRSSDSGSGDHDGGGSDHSNTHNDGDGDDGAKFSVNAVPYSPDTFNYSRVVWSNAVKLMHREAKTLRRDALRQRHYLVAAAVERRRQHEKDKEVAARNSSATVGLDESTAFPSRWEQISIDPFAELIGRTVGEGEEGHHAAANDYPLLPSIYSSPSPSLSPSSAVPHHEEEVQSVEAQEEEQLYPLPFYDAPVELRRMIFGKLPDVSDDEDVIHSNDDDKVETMRSDGGSRGVGNERKDIAKKRRRVLRNPYTYMLAWRRRIIAYLNDGAASSPPTPGGVPPAHHAKSKTLYSSSAMAAITAALPTQDPVYFAHVKRGRATALREYCEELFAVLLEIGHHRERMGLPVYVEADPTTQPTTMGKNGALHQNGPPFTDGATNNGEEKGTRRSVGNSAAGSSSFSSSPPSAPKSNTNNGPMFVCYRRGYVFTARQPPTAALLLASRRGNPLNSSTQPSTPSSHAQLLNMFPQLKLGAEHYGGNVPNAQYDVHRRGQLVALTTANCHTRDALMVTYQSYWQRYGMCSSSSTRKKEEGKVLQGVEASEDGRGEQEEEAKPKRSVANRDAHPIFALPTAERVALQERFTASARRQEEVLKEGALALLLEAMAPLPTASSLNHTDVTSNSSANGDGATTATSPRLLLRQHKPNPRLAPDYFTHGHRRPHARLAPLIARLVKRIDAAQRAYDDVFMRYFVRDQPIKKRVRQPAINNVDDDTLPKSPTSSSFPSVSRPIRLLVPHRSGYRRAHANFRSIFSKLSIDGFHIDSIVSKRGSRRDNAAASTPMLLKDFVDFEFMEGLSADMAELDDKTYNVSGVLLGEAARVTSGGGHHRTSVMINAPLRSYASHFNTPRARAQHALLTTDLFVGSHGGDLHSIAILKPSAFATEIALRSMDESQRLNSGYFSPLAYGRNIGYLRVVGHKVNVMPDLEAEAEGVGTNQFVLTLPDTRQLYSVTVCSWLATNAVRLTDEGALAAGEVGGNAFLLPWWCRGGPAAVVRRLVALVNDKAKTRELAMKKMDGQRAVSSAEAVRPTAEDQSESVTPTDRPPTALTNTRHLQAVEAILSPSYYTSRAIPSGYGFVVPYCVPLEPLPLLVISKSSAPANASASSGDVTAVSLIGAGALAITHAHLARLQQDCGRNITSGTQGDAVLSAMPTSPLPPPSAVKASVFHNDADFTQSRRVGEAQRLRVEGTQTLLESALLMQPLQAQRIALAMVEGVGRGKVEFSPPFPHDVAVSSAVCGEHSLDSDEWLSAPWVFENKVWRPSKTARHKQPFRQAGMRRCVEHMLFALLDPMRGGHGYDHAGEGAAAKINNEDGGDGKSQRDDVAPNNASPSANYRTIVSPRLIAYFNAVAPPPPQEKTGPSAPSTITIADLEHRTAVVYWLLGQFMRVVITPTTAGAVPPTIGAEFSYGSNCSRWMGPGGEGSSSFALGHDWGRRPLDELIRRE